MDSIFLSISRHVLLSQSRTATFHVDPISEVSDLFIVKIGKLKFKINDHMISIEIKLNFRDQNLKLDKTKKSGAIF